MDKFELFCMMYFTLESYYTDLEQNENLGDLLSGLNPFLWEDRGSADPAYFSDFSKLVSQNDIPIDGSYALARKYLETLDWHKEEALTAYDSLGEEEWIRATKEYLSGPHK